MKGARVLPDTEGWLDEDQMKLPGAYGQPDEGEATADDGPDSPFRRWQITTPSGDRGALNPAKHQVIEHEDGTITVKPSIVTDHWHGWLTRGDWISA